MSTKYKKSSEVPTSVLCDRLKQLSDAITKGRPNDHEFTMRIPAECDRDADIVMSEAAKRLLNAESELESLKKSEQELRMQYISDFGQEQQCYEENAKLKAELEAIKKQEPLCVVENKNLAKLADGKKAKVYGCAPHMLYNPDYHSSLFAKPVYQHTFTVDGHTFYADNEVDILYLERKFGVGGKAKLEVVKGD